MHHHTTIKDIAKALNISVSTVSRALRDTYDVSAETRERVVQKAAELKYKPNFNARGLSQGRTHNIGIILPSINNYYFSTVITGIQKTAYLHGYNIILYVTNDSSEREIDIIDNLSVSSLDGLLISTCCNHCGHIEEVSSNIPVVFFDRTGETPGSKVMQDDFNGAYEATNHLIMQGYSRIAHIAGPEGQLFTKKRLNGYKAALTANGMAIREDWIIHSGFSQHDGENDTEYLLSLSKPPDAIFAVNDRKAIGAMLALKKKGITIGRGVGVVGFTNDPVSEIISPTLTTMAEPAFDIGRISCELLLKHINKKSFAPQEVILPGELMVRESSKRRPAPEAASVSHLENQQW